MYTYVPLAAHRHSTKARQAADFRLVGTARYLLARHVGTTYAFALATYTVAPPKTPPALAARQTLAEAAARPMPFAAFSGTLVLRGLTQNEHAIYVYQQGAVVKQTKPAVAARAASASATTSGSYDCITIYTCYWQSYCTDGNGGHFTYGAVTQGINGCDQPSQEACGTSNWGMSWDSNGSSTSESCTYVEDPPVPDPNDPNDPGSPDGGSSADFDATIDDSALKPCMGAVLTDLKGLGNGRVADVIKKFAGQSPGYNWTVQDGSLRQGTNGVTNSYDRVNHKVITTFDASQFQQATDLSIARTILHESIHAYLGAFFADDYNLAGAAYSDMVMAYATQTKSTANDLQHDEMVRGWVQDIADALQQYGVSKGYTLPASFYANLAWGGLEGTRAFKNLPAATKTAIRDTILSELQGTDSAGNSKSPSGTLAGC